MTIFGVHTGLQNTSTDELVPLWRHIEDLGFDWISIWDHFYAADLTGAPNCLEAVAAHTALAMATSRVRCGSLVYCVAYRHPAVLAKAITTIDQLSGGRADIGLGAGWSEVEFKAYGIPFLRTGQRLDMLEEAAECVRGLLHQDMTTFSGSHFQLSDAANVPRPVQEKLPVWIGGGGEKRTLRIAARFADGWNIPFVAPEEFARKRGVLHGHCADVGRDPAEVRCAVNLGVSYSEADFEEQFGNMRMLVKPGVLTGSDEEMRDRIGRYVDAGADQINIAIRVPFNVENLDRLAAALGITAP